jgi:hypothetical protein
LIIRLCDGPGYDGPQFRKQYKQFDACRDAQVQELMHEIAYTRINRPNLARCAELVESILRPAKAQGLVPVWSWESYSTDVLSKQRQRARNLRDVFGDVNILVTIRHPVDLLESVFLQQLKRDNVGSGARDRRRVFCCTFNEWLESELQREVACHLSYVETIKSYMQLFGRERLTVMVFEELRRDSKAFFTRVCKAIGVSPQEGVELAAGERDNTRWTQAQLDVLRSIHDSWHRSLQFRFAKRQQRCAMLGLDGYGIPLLHGSKADLAISADWRDKILELTHSGNQWLAEVFDLPLREFGYLKS